MWDAGPGEHPDEGTIHAWLDGALDDASAERVAAHVRGCTACSALAAEARGLIAGASRIVSALDDVPAGTRPVWAHSEISDGAVRGPEGGVVGEDRSLWRRLRVTPARAAIAATILVALGVTLTHKRVAMESVQPVATLPAGHSELRSDVAGATGGAVAAATAAPKQKDGLLDSAVARNLSIAQGTPRLEAAREPAIPQAPPPSATPEADAPVAVAEQRVASGRSAVQMQRDTAAVAADRLRVRGEVTGGMAARAADEVAVAAPAPARQGMSNAAPGMSGAAAKVSQQPYADVGAASCYSLESPRSGAMWGDQPLPLIVVVDSGPVVGTRSATVRSGATGSATRVAWMRNGKDSVVIALQRVGLTGSIALGPDAGGRAGTATSGAIAASSELAATRRADAEDARAKAAKPAAAPPSAAPLPVTLRPIACPTR